MCKTIPNIKPVLIVLAVILSTGCAGLREKSYHIISAVDAGQTSQFQHNCLGEANPVTRKILGAEPNTASTLAFFLARSAMFHYGEKRFTGRRWWSVVGWSLVAGNTYYVAQNSQNAAECN